MKEYHFKKVEDVGLAWSENRVWVCFNGQAVFRAKVINGKLFTDFYLPEEIKPL